MSYCVHGKSDTAFVERPVLSWRALVNRVTNLVRTCYTRRRQRQDLLDYLASDFRAAADIGITNCEARAMSQQPFWRA
jgi:uncharacterized protein YjiS (DUF1127 family)